MNLSVQFSQIGLIIKTLSFFLIQKASRPYAALKFAGVEVFFNKIHTHFANSLLSIFFLKFQLMVRFAIFEP